MRVAAPREHEHFSWHALAPGMPYFQPHPPTRSPIPSREIHTPFFASAAVTAVRISALNFLAATVEKDFSRFFSPRCLNIFIAFPFEHGSFNHFISPPLSPSLNYLQLTLKYLVSTRREISSHLLVLFHSARKDHSPVIPVLYLCFIYISSFVRSRCILE